MSYSIVTRNLSRHFGKLVAVNELNLNIPEGALFGLIGPNGAGKTTTLRMLAGLLDPSSGVIRISGLAIRDYWNELQWQIGYMPDFFGVYEDLLVWEYLDFFARCYKLSARRRHRVINELLELVDLGGKRDTFVHTLSRGMRQRLCLAHALVHDPQILLLDEPASGLDPRARVEMRELLRELKYMGKTIILSSHILSELADLCDEIGVIEKGALITSGSIEAIRRNIFKTRLLKVKILSDPTKTIKYLSEQTGINQISSLDSDSRQLLIEFSGSESEAADLLQKMITRNIRISSFAEKNSDLEEIFLQLTSEGVS